MIAFAGAAALLALAALAAIKAHATAAGSNESCNT
jgi:hypothetical protein